ncbi:hypothetical protein MAJ_10380, partial [Metarhizium majus ARSEF 297]
MIPIVFLFFIIATCQEMIGNISNHKISKLKSHIIGKRPDLVETELGAAGYYADRHAWAKVEKPLPNITSINAICGCPANDMFSLAYVFRAAGDKPKIDFIPIQDTEPTYGDVLRQTTTMATNTLSWKWEHAVQVGFNVEFSIGTPKTLQLFRTSVSRKVTDTTGEEVTTTWTKQVAEARTYKCRSDHRCQLQTWTFVAEYEGDYYEMPVADFQCLTRSVKWEYKSGASRQLANSSKVSFASLLGKEDSWDRLSQRYFTARDRKTGEEMAEASDQSSYALDVDFPPESVEIIPKNNSVTRGPATFPIMDDKGEPYRVTVLFDYAVKEDGAGKRKRDVLDGDLASDDVELEIFVVDTNIPHHDVDIVLANGTVMRAK